MTSMQHHWRHNAVISRPYDSHCENSRRSLEECRLSARWPPILKPSQSTWAVSPPVCCYRPHLPSPFITVSHPESRYLFYRPKVGGRLSRPGTVPHVPNAVYHVGCDKQLFCNGTHLFQDAGLRHAAWVLVLGMRNSTFCFQKALDKQNYPSWDRTWIPWILRHVITRLCDLTSIAYIIGVDQILNAFVCRCVLNKCMF